MSTIGEAIRMQMRKRRMSARRVAERATALRQAAGGEGGEITERQVRDLRHRATIRVDDPTEPLPFVLQALGVEPEVVLRAAGWREGIRGLAS